VKLYLVIAKLAFLTGIMWLQLPAGTKSNNDFAPLYIGNKWRYHGTGGSAYGSNDVIYWSSIRTLEIKSKSESSGVATYHTVVYDTTISTHQLDQTKWTSLDTMQFDILDSGKNSPVISGTYQNSPTFNDLKMMKTCFLHHEYPDSTIASQNVDGNIFTAVEVTLPSISYILVENVGLYYYKNESPGPHLSPEEYRLGKYTVFDSTIGIMVRKRSNSTSRSIDFLNSKKRDALGRIGERADFPDRVDRLINKIYYTK
jgi:hypothetical protein